MSQETLKLSYFLASQSDSCLNSTLLCSQLRRSSNSAPANLSEGFNNKHTNIYLEGISRAQGEIRETIHHLKISFHKQYINQEKFDYLLKEYDVCGRMLTNLEKSLKS